MKLSTYQRSKKFLAMAAVTLLLSACASAPKPIAALEDARSAYQRASSDPHVARSAPIELRKAQQALQQAEGAQRAGKDMSLIEHYARLSRQRTEIAVQTGELALADKAVADAAAQRDQIVIASRTQEADSQRAAAERARLQAEAQRNQAEQARKLAEERLAAAQASQAAAQASQAKAASEAARARTLEQQLADLKAKQTNRGMVLTLGDVLFDTGRAELKPGAERSLDQLVTFMVENPTRSVVIEGYTDSMGSENSNQILSERRAFAVRNALVARGIPSDRITARGFGEASPVASNSTAAGRQQNRRVEIVISGG